MRVIVKNNPAEMGLYAGTEAAIFIRRAIEERGRANIIVATGTSQFATIETLVAATDIDWSRVVGFHLDEYLGMPMSHPASFRGYLKHRLVDRVPIGTFHYIDAEAPAPEVECDRLGDILLSSPIDVALVGIGENGHLAFNDPPADFDTVQPYIVVDLDEDCRRQQLGEGWFSSLEEVPRRAISMSVRQILKASAIVCSAPDSRKASAVRGTIEGNITPDVPASILQDHPNVQMCLDTASASLLGDCVG